MTRRLQRRLLAETALTYDKAFTLAQALEAADRSAKELEKGSGIHAVFQQGHLILNMDRKRPIAHVSQSSLRVFGEYAVRVR